jgi:hypothetical protein
MNDSLWMMVQLGLSFLLLFSVLHCTIIIPLTGCVSKHVIDKGMITGQVNYQGGGLEVQRRKMYITVDIYL